MSLFFFWETVEFVEIKCNNKVWKMHIDAAV